MEVGKRYEVRLGPNGLKVKWWRWGTKEVVLERGKTVEMPHWVSRRRHLGWALRGRKIGGWNLRLWSETKLGREMKRLVSSCIYLFTNTNLS